MYFLVKKKHNFFTFMFWRNILLRTVFFLFPLQLEKKKRSLADDQLEINEVNYLDRKESE